VYCLRTYCLTPSLAYNDLDPARCGDTRNRALGTLKGPAEGWNPTHEELSTLPPHGELGVIAQDILLSIFPLLRTFVPERLVRRG
jgi:hypothetical protein